MLTKLREKAKRLIERHGAEVGTVAKIAANALIPGAPLIVNAVEAVCDYTADKGQDLTDERMSEMIEAESEATITTDRVVTTQQVIMIE